MTGPADARQKYLAEHPDMPTSFTGRLMAWDPIAQKEVWRSGEFINQTVLDAIVLQGTLSERGMASFKDYLKDNVTVALRAYLISVAEAALRAPAAGAAVGTGRAPLAGPDAGAAPLPAAR